MKKLEYQITINAPAKKVWETMLHPDTYRQWIAGAWPDSLYQGNWAENEEVRFVDENGGGTLVHIHTFRPYEYVGMEHMAILLPGGEKDTTSDMAKDWVGITEEYFFEETGSGTLLIIVMQVMPRWEQMLSEGWPKALAQLKALCDAGE